MRVPTIKSNTLRREFPISFVRELKKRADDMRQNPTRSELLFDLKLLEIGFKQTDYDVQYVMMPYIYDFRIQSLKLFIEIDGGSHNSEKAKIRDVKKDKLANDRGYTVMHIQNIEVPYIKLKDILSFVAAERI